MSKGVVSGGGKSVTYGQLARRQAVQRHDAGELQHGRNPATQRLRHGGIAAGQAPAKPVEPVHAGRDARRRGSTSRTIVTGHGHLHPERPVPGCCTAESCGRAARCVYGFGAPIVSVDESSITHIPGVQVVRKGDFLGVVAPQEYDAIQAAAQLKVKWADPPAALPGSGNEFKGMRALDSAGKTVQSVRSRLTCADSGNVDAALASAAHVVSRDATAGRRTSTPRSARSARSPT